MDEKIKNFITPHDNMVVQIKNAIFVVTKREPDKLRFTAKFIAMAIQVKETGEVRFLMVNEDRLTIDEFEAWRRKRYPMPHEKNRNPDNPTLGVHSVSSESKQKFKTIDGKGGKVK